MTTITTAGEQFLAAFASGSKTVTAADENGQPMLADQMIVAYIDGLDVTETPPKTETVPATILATCSVNLAGLANDHTAVFSAVIPASEGDWSFNWLGLYNSQYDILVAVDYVPITPKTASEGSQVGNSLNHTFALTMSSAAAVTGLTVTLESWQPDYTARNAGTEEINRQALLAVFGPAAFETAAGEITQATEYTVNAGRACIAGLLVDIPETELTGLAAEATAAHPFYVYATATQQGDVNGLSTWATVETSQTALASYTSGGYIYHRALLATITAPGVWTDNRESVASELMAATVKTANDTAASAVQTANSAASTAADAVTAAAAAQSTADDAATAAATAQSTADTAVTAAAAAQSTADTAVTAAATAQSTADSAMASDMGNMIITTEDARSAFGLKIIEVTSAGAIVTAPTGWTVAKTATGTYTVTHNMGKIVPFIPMVIDTFGWIREDASEQTTSQFSVAVSDDLDASSSDNKKDAAWRALVLI